MRVLIVKTSSLGDVIHTLPAVSDAVRARPELRFDWVVEESLKEIPAWHPAVDDVIPVALRRWRRHPLKAWRSGQWRSFIRKLQAHQYGAVIDAQGLLKSAFLTRYARGPVFGLDRYSAREPLSARFYDRPLAVPRAQHAVSRVRQLFSEALAYTLPTGAADYGLRREHFVSPVHAQDYIVALHGTAWETKLWPEAYWVELIRLAGERGLEVLLPWGSEQERDRAERLADHSRQGRVLERMNLADMAGVLAGARGVAAVDTGLAHLAAALGVPAVAIYGATQPGLTGTLGAHQKQLHSTLACAPCLQRRCHYRGSTTVEPACYASVPPDKVWATLETLLQSAAEQDKH